MAVREAERTDYDRGMRGQENHHSPRPAQTSDTARTAQEALGGWSGRGEQLLEAARHLTASLDVREVLTRIAEGARDVLEAYGSTIYLLEPDGKTLWPVVAIEPPFEEEVLSTPIDVETSFTGQAIKAKRGVMFNEALDDSLGQQIPGTPEEEDERVIAAPFIVDGEVLGAMCVKRTGTPFTLEELSLAETFGAFASTALKNARTHRDLSREVEERKRAEVALRESKREIEELHEVARVLQSCQDERAACDAIIEAADRFLRLKDWRLVDPEGRPLPPHAEQAIAQPKHPDPVTTAQAVAGESPNGLARDQQDTSAAGVIRVPVGDGIVFEAALHEDTELTHEEEQILDLLLGHLAEALKRIRLQNDLREQAIRDPLTKVYNRHYLEHVLRRETKRSERYDRAIGFLMIDVNDFKHINDRFGHQIGDRVLEEVAELLLNELRETDVVVRYGGDEFLVILPEAGDRVGPVRQRILHRVGSVNERIDPALAPITLSIGVAAWSPGKSQAIEQVLAEADRRMYEHKRAAENPPPG
jgi:diguanylate cyclase (GGDEF)-like protein